MSVITETNHKTNKATTERLEVVWDSRRTRSRLYRADCLEVMARMRDGTVDCVWTDPPYFLSNNGMTCVAGRMVSVNKGDWDRSKGRLEDDKFNIAWVAECYRILRNGGSMWVSGTVHSYLSVGPALLSAGFVILNDIIWEKPAPPPNLGRRCFTHSTETLLWATKPINKKKQHVFHYDVMREENLGKQMKNVWRMGTPPNIEKKFGKHPTQKPVALVERCLRATTNVGALVFDPFAGSGTTGVAALRLDRRFCGAEIHVEYASVAAKRLSAVV